MSSTLFAIKLILIKINVTLAMYLKTWVLIFIKWIYSLQYTKGYKTIQILNTIYMRSKVWNAKIPLSLHYTQVAKCLWKRPMGLHLNTFCEVLLLYCFNFRICFVGIYLQLRNHMIGTTKQHTLASMRTNYFKWMIAI